VQHRHGRELLGVGVVALKIVSQLTLVAEELARAGIRERHPNATGREIELRLGALHPRPRHDGFSPADLDAMRRHVRRTFIAIEVAVAALLLVAARRLDAEHFVVRHDIDAFERRNPHRRDLDAPALAPDGGTRGVERRDQRGELLHVGGGRVPAVAEARAAPPEGNAERRELLREPADPDAEQETPLRHEVETRGLLREQQRIRLREDVHARRESHALGVRCDRSERDQRIDELRLGRDGHLAVAAVRVLRRVVDRHDDVLEVHSDSHSCASAVRAISIIASAPFTPMFTGIRPIFTNLSSCADQLARRAQYCSQRSNAARIRS
jgi:hypothetical protein